MTEHLPEDELGRAKLTQARRIELLERDRAQQSRAITELINKVSKGFTPEQLEQIRTAFREELADAGLRLEDAKSQDAAREDFRWLRRARLAWDGAASKIGGAVLAAILVIAGAVIASGVVAWLQNVGKPPT
jgi:hypothetical protein